MDASPRGNAALFIYFGLGHEIEFCSVLSFLKEAVTDVDREDLFVFGLPLNVISRGPEASGRGFPPPPLISFTASSC